MDENVKVKCYEHILNKYDDGILISDSDGKIIFYNEMMGKMEGRNPINILNKYLKDVYNHSAKCDSEHNMVFRTGKPLLNKYRNFSFINNKIGPHISYSTYPIKVDGKTVSVYTVCKDEQRLQELLSETIELKRRLVSEDISIKKGDLDNGTSYSFSDIAGDSISITNVIKEAQTMASSQSNILIIGETGTGKELFAQSIHNYSKKKNEPFVPINCAAIPENLLESILFGTVKGAYTGAVDTPGLFEIAGNGTLFLDELNSMPMAMQTKLLRVLQEKKGRRVGELTLYSINCRIISAVNENPKRMIDEGKMRRDLFYRIAALTLCIPPLRSRKKDIESLIRYYIKKFNRFFQKNIFGIDSNLKKILLKHSWPGNVRELEYVMENLMIRVHNKNLLTLDDIPEYIKLDLQSETHDKTFYENVSVNMGLKEALDNFEREYIIKALQDTNWNVSKTADKLNLVRQTLRYKMKRLSIPYHFYDKK